METPEERYAPLYADGRWSTVLDEITMLWDRKENEHLGSAEIYAKAGFGPWVQFGSLDGFSLPMSVEVYQRSEDHKREPQYVVDVEGTGGHIPHVYARTLPDVMDLLGKWAPTVQATAVTELLRQLNNPDERVHRSAPVIKTLRDLLSGE